MVNARAKIKKIQNIRNTLLSHASTDDHGQPCSESGVFIGSNEYLLTEILIRLPVTSILRFKAVSKQWHSLLSHRHFTVRYDKLLKSPGFFSGNVYVPFDDNAKIRRGTPLVRFLYFCFDHRGIRIEQSCNGLLLCCSNGRNVGVRKYYVFNPTTKQFAIIPSVPGGYAVRKTIYSMSLACYQTDCVHYKIVCILNTRQVLMYSSDVRRWKICIESFSGELPRSKGVYWNGAIHWAPSYRSHFYFDISSERFQTCPSPSATNLTLYLGESRGHLHLVVITDNGRRVFEPYSALKVYEMLNDHSGWFVKYEVKLDELTFAFPKSFGLYGYTHDDMDVVNVMDVVRGQKEENTFLVLRKSGVMIRYNVYDKSVNHLDPYNDNDYLDFHRYTETLTSF